MRNRIIFTILFLAFFLRFFKLGEVPLSLNWDENSNAYNAYSILKTARDEYGNLLPLTNRSFDDFKPPLYMYLSVPTIAIFDLTQFAARFPSAIFGVLTVGLIYLIVKRLFGNILVALISAFLLSISSWHLQFSRVGFEANIGLFFTVAAFTSFMYSLQYKKSKLLLILSAILFGLSAYSYHAQRVFIPLLFIATLFIYKNEIFQLPKKWIATFLLTSFIIVLPLAIFLPRDDIVKRFTTTTEKARFEDIDKSISFIEQDKIQGINFANLIHNRRILIGLTFLNNYLIHFDPNFLFVEGDANFRHHVQNMGMFYLIQLPLLLYGLFLFIKERTKGQIFLLSWLVLSPIPAIAGDAVPHAIRSFTMIIPLTIISAFALSKMIYIKRYKFILINFSLIILILSFFPYLHNYWNHYPRDHSDAWQYGYSQAVKKTQQLSSQFEKINISSDIEQAYIFWLFTTKYNPQKYQNEGSKEAFGKYYFNSERPINFNELYISGGLPENYQLIDVVKNPRGEDLIIISNPK